MNIIACARITFAGIYCEILSVCSAKGKGGTASCAHTAAGSEKQCRLRGARVRIPCRSIYALRGAQVNTICFWSTVDAALINVLTQFADGCARVSARYVCLLSVHVAWQTCRRHRRRRLQHKLYSAEPEISFALNGQTAWTGFRVGEVSKSSSASASIGSIRSDQRRNILSPVL